MFRKLALITLVLAIATALFGAYVHLSGSGLGCPDWPGCYGKFFLDEPPGAGDTNTFDAGYARLQLAHRYLAGVLSVSVLLLSMTAWWVRENRTRLIALALSSLALVIAQSLLGMWSVQLKMLPVNTTGHLLLGLITLSLLQWLYLESRSGGVPFSSGSPGLRALARAGLLILLIEIALGGWTSANRAGLACPDFPTCLGSWWPEADYREGFTLWRTPLPEEQAAVLSPAARAAIHWTHRLGAGVAFLLLSGLAIGISSNRQAARVSKSGVVLSFLLLAEISLGIAAVLLRLPVAVSLAHYGLAVLLLLDVVYINVYLRRPKPSLELSKAAAEALAPAPTRPAVPPAVEIPPPRPVPGMFERLRGQLGKTRGNLTGMLASLAMGRKAIDRELLDEIEERLVMADIGVAATGEIIQELTQSLERHELADWSALTERLRQQLYGLLQPCSVPLEIPPEVRPFVILVVGVNGVGKTTTIGKLAKRLQNQGHSVMLAAGDTFRAAAVEQLQAWGERNQVPVIAQQSGADSASVIFDAVQSAQARNLDVLIADTAGRLHTKSNLMEELRKIKRIIGRLDESAPHEVLLVVDAGTGQNAINQARQFDEAVGLTGIALTKLDGTAKGGVIFALAKQFRIPIRFIGIGESIDDLQDFDAEKFIAALFETEERPARLH